jgi:hypothetical protein
LTGNVALMMKVRKGVTPAAVMITEPKNGSDARNIILASNQLVSITSHKP